MRMSERGKKLLAEWEDSVPTVYRDAAGLQTIGVGHLMTREELTSGQIVIAGAPVKFSQGLTHPQMMALMGQDMERFERAVDEMVTVDLDQHQFDALVCFAFNVGVWSFRNSSLLRLLNQGRYDAVPEQLARWVKADWKTVPGLVNRRKNEIKLWTGEI